MFTPQSFESRGDLTDKTTKKHQIGGRHG